MLADSTQWQAPYMADKCQVVEELVDKLQACRGLCYHTFRPWLQTAIWVACVMKDGVPMKTMSSTICSRPWVHCLGTASTWSQVTLRRYQEGSLACTLIWSTPAQGRSAGGYPPLSPLCSGYERERDRSPACYTPCARTPICTSRKLPTGSRTRSEQLGGVCICQDCQLTVLPSHSSYKKVATFSIEMIPGVQLADSHLSELWVGWRQLSHRRLQ